MDNRMSMNNFEYEFLTDSWVGVKGAAFNQVYEFCKEFGWCDQAGSLTSKGREAIEEYEKDLKNGS